MRRGLRRREAQARCPQLHVVTADPARDARHFEGVTAAVDEVVPRAEVLRPGLLVDNNCPSTRLFRWLTRLPVISLPGLLQPGASPVAPIQVSDVARCVARIAEHPKALQRGIELTGPEVMTYRELYEDARSIANGLRELGTGRGDRILIVLPTCMDFLAVFFACQMVGAIPVPAYPPSGFRIETGLKRLAHIAQHSGSRLCVTWGTVGPLISEIAHTAKSLERVVNVQDLRGGRLPELHATRRDEPAFIQYTSGSTGNPKGVLLSHRNLITNIHGMGQALHIDHNDVLVGWCPLYHDMGLIGTFLSAVYWRLPLVLLSPSAFLTKPRRWLRAMSDYGGTISPAPNFGYALAVKRVKEADRAGLDLSRWRVALNGAEPVTEGVVREFQDTYAPYGFRPTAMPTARLFLGSPRRRASSP